LRAQRGVGESMPDLVVSEAGFRYYGEVMKRRGFTLIELLVVISVVALLMAILMPALRRARAQGHGAVCMSNMRQIGLAAYMYSDDWDTYIPRGTQNSTETWYQLFMPYLNQRAIGDDYRNVKIYRCPAYPDKEQTVCFVNNGWDFKDTNDIVGFEISEPTPTLNCRRLDKTIYLADNSYGPWRDIITELGDFGWHMCDVWDPLHLPSNEYAGTNAWGGRRIAATRHIKKGGGCNVLYLDWHVGWVAAEDMDADMWRWWK